MKHVYLLQSRKFPEERYVGLADDFRRRLTDHNAGKSSRTAKFKPWSVVAVIQFEKEKRAFAFEKYLKSGSVRAFANKHFW